MLDARSSNFLSIFTNADRQSLGIGIRSKMLVPKYMRGYAMYLNGESPDTYGRLVSWENDREACFNCFKGIALDPGMGLFVLEVQRDLLQFLVKVAKLILHDYSLSNLPRLLTAGAGDHPTPGHLRPQEVKKSSLSSLTQIPDSLTAHVLEEPYRAPDAFDFTRVRDLVDAKCHEADDHLHLIREDPGYFAELIHEACTHTAEAAVGLRPTLSNQAKALFHVLSTAYQDVFSWKCIACLLDDMDETYSERKANIKLGKVLPEAYVQAFSRLCYFLGSVIDEYLANFPNYISAVPTFKKQIKIESASKAGVSRRMFMVNPDDYLFWLFTKSLNGEKDQQQISGLANVSQEMETLITKKQEEKKRLSWRLIRSISDIAVIAEMQRQMGLSTCNDYSLSAYSEEDNNAWMSARMKPFLDILNVLIDHDELEPLVESLRAFDYPVEKPRTAAITARLQSAERALDKLWAGLDELFIRKTCKSLEELGGNTFKYRNLQRTLDWTVPYSEKSDRKSTDDVDASLALILLEERTESTLVQSQVSGARHKTKTRGSTVQADSTEPKPHTAANATGISFLRLTVRKKAFNTFAAVFGLPIADSLPGEVPWNDFKKAMVNVGFSAEKLQGSGWLFKPADSPSLGLSSIIFHEPHPESKMPMQVARRIARRLKRDFGWTADTFVTEQAVSE